MGELQEADFYHRLEVLGFRRTSEIREVRDSETAVGRAGLRSLDFILEREGFPRVSLRVTIYPNRNVSLAISNPKQDFYSFVSGVDPEEKTLRKITDYLDIVKRDI